MKKILLLLLVATMLLCGCYDDNEKEDISDYSGELSKAQQIAVIPVDTSHEMKILKESGELSEFISALDTERWELDELPETADVLGTFVFSQEETVKFGESATDGELYQVCEMICYEEIPYITLKMAELEMTFKVSGETAEYLGDWFCHMDLA